MKVYMIRHGETAWNKQHKMQGHSDIPLNEYGRELAVETSKGLKDVPFTMCYTSPLVRARETAEIILGEREVPIIEEPRIIEIGFGEFEGGCAQKDNWTIADPDFRNFFDDPTNYNVPKGGESFETVMDRVGDFLNELFHNEDLKEETILIASHGAAIKSMMNYMKQIPVSRFWEGGLHKNCGVTIVNVTDGVPKILEEGTIYYE